MRKHKSKGKPIISDYSLRGWFNKAKSEIKEPDRSLVLLWNKIIKSLSRKQLLQEHRIKINTSTTIDQVIKLTQLQLLLQQSTPSQLLVSPLLHPNLYLNNLLSKKKTAHSKSKAKLSKHPLKSPHISILNNRS